MFCAIKQHYKENNIFPYICNIKYSMGYFGLTFFRICINEFGERYINFFLENWFLEDCEKPLDCWKQSNRLLEILNSINLSIKFIVETSDKELLFLDILMKRNNKIWMHSYFKSTETCWCLPSSSSHTNHCRKITLFTLVERICIIVENQQRKLRHLSESKETLQEYDYPKKALEIPQNEIKKPKEKQTDEFLPFISTFNPNNLPLYNAIQNSVKVIMRNSVPEFKSIKHINSNRQQQPKLKKLLAKA